MKLWKCVETYQHFVCFQFSEIFFMTYGKGSLPSLSPLSLKLDKFDHLYLWSDYHEYSNITSLYMSHYKKKVKIAFFANGDFPCLPSPSLKFKNLCLWSDFYEN